MQCYNIGCSKKFEANENSEKSCRYHLSTPVFHDGRKGWDCCKKFSTDFNTCLDTPGCQLGYHNPNKPAEPVKPKLDPKFDKPVVVVTPIEIKTERPSGDEPMVDLPIQEIDSLRMEISMRQEEIANESYNAFDISSVPIGTPCKNNGCKRLYTNSDANKEICIYHNGEAIFHEGMKYRTCCNRKTSDWDSFMEQEGCTSGQHMWFKKAVATDIRFDWFQAGSNVTITLYTKLALPDSMMVKSNHIKLFVAYEYDCGAIKYEKEFNLWGTIDTRASYVKVSRSKVEIVLVKKKLSSWDALEWRQCDKN